MFLFKQMSSLWTIKNALNLKHCHVAEIEKNWKGVHLASSWVVDHGVMKNVIINIMVSITYHAKGDYSSFINILKKLSTTNRCLLECPHKKQNTDRSMNHGSAVWCVSGPTWTESMLKGMGPCISNVFPLLFFWRKTARKCGHVILMPSS